MSIYINTIVLRPRRQGHPTLALVRLCVWQNHAETALHHPRLVLTRQKMRLVYHLIIRIMTFFKSYFDESVFCYCFPNKWTKSRKWLENFSVAGRIRIRQKFFLLKNGRHCKTILRTYSFIQCLYSPVCYFFKRSYCIIRNIRFSDFFLQVF